ncbi:MAG TPA: ATP-binding protein, partial [Candidatus Dormibacteraeota bacterium]|nr:ATP-binding protein [Candidatus Dormibacteraeota bacterium]
LGLAICRSILWENGGDMSIDSQPGRGTVVTVTLPVARKEAHDESASARGAGKAAPPAAARADA